MSTEKYKILSLDGGGSWAILQAMALHKLYPKETNREILNSFDMVVANSGGSLILAAMMETNSMKDVFELFDNETKRKSIFSKLSFFHRSLLRILSFAVGPKYSTSEKIVGLRNSLPILGRAKLSKIPDMIGTSHTRYMIMGFDYDKQRATFFRSDLRSPSLATIPTDDVELAQAIHASSNAPVNYFNKPATFQCGNTLRRFWDGAVGGNNNPSLVGVIEAMAYGIAPSAIRILSIGTGNNLMPIRGISPGTGQAHSILIDEPKKQSLLNDIPKMTKSILQEPPDAASYMAHIAIGGGAANQSPTNMVRLNPLIQPLWNHEQNKWVLPAEFPVSTFQKLHDMEMDAVETDQLNAVIALGELWLQDKAANQSLRYDGYFQPQIGFDKFSLAAARWNQIK